MTRKSSVITKHDRAGDYEVEIFDLPNPKRVIVCSHGNGVRRWDGEKFFYAVAEHYDDSAVLLADQNQPEGDGVKLNPLPVLVARVEELVQEAQRLHPDVPVVLIGHSMGCGVATQMDTSNIDAIIFVAPGTDSPGPKLIKAFGQDVVNGKTTISSDGLKKIITAEYFDSIKNITSWEDEYAKFAKRYEPIYVFEAGEDDILSTKRFTHREIPFTKYEIIKGAKHNFTGKPLADLFTELDKLM